MQVKQEIIKALSDAVKGLGLSEEDIKIQLERPADENHGDYSTNIALVISKILKKNPFELAEKIASSVQRLASSSIDKVEAVKPGFINFWISREWLINNLQLTLKKKDEYGKGDKLKDKKIMVEFTDPNPFKEFHIGHLYSNTVGETLSRILESQGADLRRANYQGDVGMHVAKALYGLFHLCHAELVSASKILENKILKQVQDDTLNKKVKFLGEAYSFGAKVYEEDEIAKKEIQELNKKIYNKEPEVTVLYEKGRQWSLEYFETIYKRLGTKFDFYYFESEVGVNGLKLVQEYLKKEVFEESQGVVIFPGKKYSLHDRVFINSLGLPTYEAKELGLAFKKYEDFKFDQSIVITGNEIIGYFKVLLAALGKIDPNLASKIKHLPHGMVRLPTGKMSSRSGNILTGEWLLDEVKRMLKENYPEMFDEVLEKVTVGAIKYALLKNGIGHDIAFNFEESISLSGNSGPYVQYVYVRTQSVLLKVTSDKRKAISNIKTPNKIEPAELSLLRALNRFEEVVEEAGKNYAPNLLCNYLFDLAQKFNLFYEKYKIIGSESEDFRLALTAAVGQVIKSGLRLLGISAPNKM
ncbi:MAG: arginine--tRNA ligase [Candidatus Levybacteria bacterium]|nr:arginine--tRNA ligase [Candidatus Levybacteria bacterium]